MLLSLFSLAFAVSLDGFGVGITYGLQRSKIPLLSILIISGCSMVAALLSMQLGVWLLRFLPSHAAKIIGAIILIGVGCWAVFNISLKNKCQSITPALDKSIVLQGSEAALLGIALSVDSFGAGIGASFLGLSSFLTPVTIGLMNCISIFGGMKLGAICSEMYWFKRFSYFPGIILILLGVLKMF